MHNNYVSRYDLGGKIIKHKGVGVKTSINTSIEDIIDKIPNKIPSQDGRVISFIEHRPDLISNIFYNSPAYWWYIMLFNNVTDPFEGFNIGDRIMIPDIHA